MAFRLLSITTQTPHACATKVPRRTFWFQSHTSDFSARMQQRINYANPASRLPYVQEAELFALPPVAKPFRTSDRKLGFYDVRARLFWAVFLASSFGYAAYLNLNERGLGRLRLLEAAPGLVHWLERSGILQPLPQSVRLVELHKTNALGTWAHPSLAESDGPRCRFATCLEEGVSRARRHTEG